MYITRKVCWIMIVLFIRSGAIHFTHYSLCTRDGLLMILIQSIYIVVQFYLHSWFHGSYHIISDTSSEKNVVEFQILTNRIGYTEKINFQRQKRVIYQISLIKFIPSPLTYLII